MSRDIKNKNNEIYNMIETVNSRLLRPAERVSVDNILFLSGGGIQALFFSLGAIQYLVDNDAFLGKFDMISATSGSVILAVIIEICYDNNLVRHKNWYSKYVVATIHRVFIENNYVVNILSNIGITNTISNINRNVKSIFIDAILASIRRLVMLPVFPKSVKNRAAREIRKYKKPLFYYNYFNANTYELSTDHSDLDNDHYKLPKLMLRCVLPVTNFNNRPSMDAGVINNCISTEILNRYIPKHATIISIRDYYIYQSYDEKSIFQTLWMFFMHLTIPSEINSTQFGSDILDWATTKVCTLSNQLVPSRDKFHRGLFEDWNLQIKNVFDIYNPYLTGQFQVLQNEGYIQAKSTFSKFKTNKKPRFTIPNPSVYNANCAEYIPRIVKS